MAPQRRRQTRRSDSDDGPPDLLKILVWQSQLPSKYEQRSRIFGVGPRELVPGQVAAYRRLDRGVSCGSRSPTVALPRIHRHQTRTPRALPARTHPTTSRPVTSGRHLTALRPTPPEGPAAPSPPTDAQASFGRSSGHKNHRAPGAQFVFPLSPGKPSKALPPPPIAPPGPGAPPPPMVYVAPVIVGVDSESLKMP